MANLAVDGLISGLDTTSLINQIMQLEAAPQTLLKTKSDTASKLVAALQSLNGKVATLATTAAAAAKTASWSRTTATSSSDTLTATTTTGALPATLQLRVERTAAGQVSMVDLAETDLGVPPSVTILRDGKLYTVTAATSGIHDVAAAINQASEAGIVAVPVRVSSGTDGEEPRYRLQLSSASGEANAFDVYVGDEATVRGYLTETPDGFVDAGTAPASVRLAMRSAAIVAARDAQVTLWPDATSPIVVTSASNTFDGVLPGVAFTVTASTPADAPVTLTVAPDPAARRALAADTVSALSTVLSEISAKSQTTKTTSEGRTVVTGGLFTGDSTVRLLADALRSAASSPVDGRSPSSVGISIDRSGNVSFDAAVFDAAMADDPAGTQALVQAVAQRVADVAARASDKVDGSITMRVRSTEGSVSDLSRQIEDWDRRLALRREGLERTYAALEVALANLQSQSTWLAGQLAGLVSSGD